MFPDRPEIVARHRRRGAGAYRYSLFLLLLWLSASLLMGQRYPWIVVMDPGHGGDDYGIRAGQGSFEKDINLLVARDFQHILSADPALDVLLTRENDRELSLRERAIQANNLSADLFISVHCAFSNRRVDRGFIVYFFQPEESQLSSFHELRSTGSHQDVRLVPWDLAQLPAAPASRDLATRLQNALNRMHGKYSGSPVGEQLELLSKVACPAVLIECCFLTNSEDERQIMDPFYRRRFAEAVRDSIMDFLTTHQYSASGRQP
ncbi:MAG: N-acetylmuramoyl-L-alanine amidase [Acidobacteria bacterium]|nr:N-acetylmuramoyl-L-alanine amidase [Acidobacteriota bacterium]